MHSRVESRGLAVVVPYLRMARADHWFKNVFMLLGVALAFFWRPELVHPSSFLRLLSALGATCIVASSNYVLNEFLDAATDREHPLKQNRPAANGEVEGWAALLLWGTLGMGGILWAFEINGPFGASAFLLWVMGCAYNIPPVRTKEIAFLDVLSESINNPIRLLLGWFALVPDRLPPLSLALAYWMAGAFFMAMKRFAEYRAIGDPARAARYRRSFKRYDEKNLLASLVFYLTAGATFAGIFIVRYKPELVLATPLMAGFFAHYMLVGLAPDSPVQHPERLHRERRLFAFALLTTVACAALLFLEMPALRELFHVQPSSIEPLWRIGS